MTIKHKRITDYQPDPNNANQGSERGQAVIEDSFRELGAGRSILVDKHGVVIAGNKSQEAALNAGIENVLEVETDGHTLVVVKRTDLDLSKDKKAKRLAIADNRASEVSLHWDVDLLTGLNAEGVLDGLFTETELQILADESSLDLQSSDEDNPYTRKIEAPTYKITGEKPSIPELYDDARTRQLVKAIETSDLPGEVKSFLTIAAHRHTVLNFAKIAEYYAHADSSLQRLMEDSALVIIDFNRAIELGFVKMTKDLTELVGQNDAR